MKKIIIVLGTRPEAIKLAPLVLALKAMPDKVDCKLCVTGQHRQMLDSVLELFGLIPDMDLELMRPNQSLGTLTAGAIEKLDAYFQIEKPDAVVVQGDTTTVFAASLTAFYHKIPIAHVEAGLRTGNMLSPWPEEANRVLTTRLAHWHFCPTKLNRDNLLKEGVLAEQIYITGNTVIDTLFWSLEKLKEEKITIPGLPGESLDFIGDRRLVLITGHRRENFGKGFEDICNAIVELGKRFPDNVFIYPVHLNPNVREPVERIIANEKLENVFLIEPQSYLPFVALMSRSYLILTDSGGVQEEAPSLGKPVLVMRDTTERPEAVIAGTVKLIGAEYDNIVNEATLLLSDENAYRKMSQAMNPYGDGHAVERIVDELLR
ncbi:MAG: UDP-N-acetylglucosamine 2-epimerase (non-hydrolyzing) [Lentisphaerae bacterium]|nr:UDP-N-acetylglucosamine 2-epimerase (non-hydrolyzing) [Lentisphaerota bacterium]